MKDDPTLLPLEQSSDEPLLRQAIGAARRELPNDARMQMLSAALAAKLPGPGGGGPDGGPGGGGSTPPADGGLSATGASSASTGAIGAKASGVIGSLLVAGGIWYATHSSASPPPPPPPTPVVAAVAKAPIAQPKAAPDPIPTLSVDDLPVAAPSAPPKPETGAPPPSAEAPRESDMALLKRAQSAVASNPAGALALCAEHERAYPRSAFAQEREVLTIQALLRVGRRGEAEARADRFARAYPKSGHNRRLNSLLGREDLTE